MHSFIFMRHGQTEANLINSISTDDAPLTSEGIKSIKLTAEKLRGEKIEKIICSPLPRAKRSAELVARTLGIDPKEIIVIDDLRERNFGDFEGQMKVHPSGWYMVLKDGNNIESSEQIIKRMQRALNQIESVAREHKTLVVGHVASGFYLIQVAKGNTRHEELDPPLKLDNADFMIINFD